MVQNEEIPLQLRLELETEKLLKKTYHDYDLENAKHRFSEYELTQNQSRISLSDLPPHFRRQVQEVLLSLNLLHDVLIEEELASGAIAAALYTIEQEHRRLQLLSQHLRVSFKNVETLNRAEFNTAELTVFMLLESFLLHLEAIVYHHAAATAETLPTRIYHLLLTLAKYCEAEEVRILRDLPSEKAHIDAILRELSLNQVMLIFDT
jgi:hypothetical protein